MYSIIKNKLNVYFSIEILLRFQAQQNKNTAPIKLNIGNTSGHSQGNIQLVVDPRMGVILGPVTQTQGNK